MAQNGLFLISIGFLIFIWRVGARIAHPDWLSFITALVLIGSGFLLLRNARKKTEMKS